jgi:hypothetical protein
MTLYRNLTIVLNILFSLCWVYIASQVMSAKQVSVYYQVASFVIIGAFMLTLLAVLVKHEKFLKVVMFVNRLFAIFLVFKLGLQYLDKPTDAGLLFLVFVVLPFVINAILIGKILIQAKTQGG